MPHQSEALDGATGDRLSMMEPSKNPTATNPWRDLPLEPPYALASDRLILERFNQKARPDHQIHLDLLPEPFLGSPDAPVVLLSLNPGFAPEDRIPHGDPTFQALSRAQLSHAPSPYPFLLLNPAVEAPGRGWWEKKLVRLLETCGRERVARGVLCVEYFPYHSRRFAHARIRVPSQEYSFHLVRAALRREAAIVLMRAERPWLDAIPELVAYPRLYRLRNRQNVILSAANCPEGYASLVAALSR